MIATTPFPTPRIANSPAETMSVVFTPDPPPVLSSVAQAAKDAAEAAAKAPVKVRVCDRYRVVWEGKAFIGGETLSVPAETAERWLKFRFVEKASRGKK